MKWGREVPGGKALGKKVRKQREQRDETRTRAGFAGTEEVVAAYLARTSPYTLSAGPFCCPTGLVILIMHCIMAFPSHSRLRRREQAGSLLEGYIR